MGARPPGEAGPPGPGCGRCGGLVTPASLLCAPTGLVRDSAYPSRATLALPGHPVISPGCKQGDVGL